MRTRCELNVLKGKVLTEIGGGKYADELSFLTNDGQSYRMYHRQDCCESVLLEDICGELEWLIGEPILIAEERCSNDPPDGQEESRDVSETWTFYELATIKGSVTLRWYGASNGYYSESVDFERVE